jgi:predicted deoxyguanosinetriphosphate triphosphohydrolase
MYDQEAIDYATDKEVLLKRLHYRIYDIDHGREDYRDELMRDYARVLYSSSFRRLQGKMQLLGVDGNKFNRNRLTHSLEVAQIARSIAHNLKLESTVAAETAALAHDIGNPPFGHHGESVLNELSSGCGGYEGNAQTFRILRSLEIKHHDCRGLNLTVRTLLAVTKYFNKRGSNNNKFLYDKDFEFLSNEMKNKHMMVDKSIDAEIMDLADEIAYAAHDLEDALSFGMINLGEILHEFKISEQFQSACSQMSDIVEKAQEEAMKATWAKTSEEYSIVLKKEVTSEVVYRLCSDIGIVDGSLGYKNYADLARGLKKLLFKAMLRKKDIQLYERRGEKIIRGLFEVFTDTKYNKGNVLLPAELRSRDDCSIRLVTDYIAGMMDSYAAQEYERFFGRGSAEELYFKS